PDQSGVERLDGHRRLGSPGLQAVSGRLLPEAGPGAHDFHLRRRRHCGDDVLLRPLGHRPGRQRVRQEHPGERHGGRVSRDDHHEHHVHDDVHQTSDHDDFHEHDIDEHDFDDDLHETSDDDFDDDFDDDLVDDLVDYLHHDDVLVDYLHHDDVL